MAGGTGHVCFKCMPRTRYKRFLLVMGVVFAVVCVVTFSKRRELDLDSDTKLRFGGARFDEKSEESAVAESVLDQWLLAAKDIVVPNRDPTPRQAPRNGSKKRHILIIASQRSGSSFLGELFKQNEDVFYAFEPIRPLTFAVLRGEMDNSLFESEAISRLYDFLTCRKVLIYKKSRRMTKGYELKTIDLTGLCRSKTHVALKEIRFYNLETLRSIAEDPGLNFKIIHLVRDPRAVMNSREQSFFSNHDFKRKRVPWDEVSDLCIDLKHNLDLISQSPRWLRDKYVLVRYEDVARLPLQAAVDIYNFVGLQLDPHVLEWVEANTRQERGGDLSTSRNSTERVMAWRNEMSYAEIVHIQHKCKEPMEMLGYETLPSEMAQHDMSFPVFRDETDLFKFPFRL